MPALEDALLEAGGKELSEKIARRMLRVRWMLPNRPHESIPERPPSLAGLWAGKARVGDMVGDVWHGTGRKFPSKKEVEMMLKEWGDPETAKKAHDMWMDHRGVRQET